MKSIFRFFYLVLLVLVCCQSRQDFLILAPILELRDSTIFGVQEYNNIMDSSLGVHLIWRTQLKLENGQDSAKIVYQNTRNDILEFNMSTNNFIGRWNIIKYDTSWNKLFGIGSKVEDVKEFDAMAYLGKDTLILLFKNQVFICNRNFHILNSFKIDSLYDLSVSVHEQFHLAAHNNKFPIQRFGSKLILSVVRNFKLEIENDRKDSTSFVMFDLLTNEVEYFTVSLPEHYKNHIWGFEDAAQFGIVVGGFLYISYPYSATMIKFNLTTKIYSYIEVKSLAQGKGDIFPVMSQKQFSTFAFTKKIDDFWKRYTYHKNSSASFSNLVYEPKYKRFIRIFYDRQPLKDNKGLYKLAAERNAYMIVMNSNLEYLYEVNLGIGFNDFVNFASYSKIHLNYNYEASNDDNQTHKSWTVKAITFKK